MTTDPPISVIVPTRNRVALLQRTLHALDDLRYPDYEVIVVDDASTDATPDTLAAWAGPDRRVIRLSHPSGSYAARNAGWRAARGAVIAFTDDDCVPQPVWLRALADALGDDRNVGVQGMTLARPGEVTPFTHQIEQTHGGPPYRTCNIAYRRDVLEAIGGFNDELRWYADNILGYEAGAWGAIAFAPDAVVLHPPRLREWRDRSQWLARFRADAVHRRYLHRRGVEVSVPGRIWPVLLWIVRPVLKQAGAHLSYARRHPARYAREIRPMLHEKWEMLLALLAYEVPAVAPVVGVPVAPERPPVSTAPLPETPRVSVIVVTRDRPDSLRLTLAAIRAQTYPHIECIVVDHAGMVSARELAECNGARYVPVLRRAGLAAARQAGVDAAHGDIVAFTDDDCLPDPEWCARLVAALRADPSLLGVQGRTVPERGPVEAHAISVSVPDHLYQTCNIAYRRDAVREAGGFDLGFRGHFEDTALGARVLEHGPIGFDPRAVVVHRAMPRREMDRAGWSSLLRDERRLATHYAHFYRRVRGPGFLAVVIARWLLGSPLKTLVRALPAGLGDPRSYLRLAASLLRERRALLQALRDVIRAPDRHAG